MELGNFLFTINVYLNTTVLSNQHVYTKDLVLMRASYIYHF